MSGPAHTLRPLTYQDYLALRERGPRLELFEGQPLAMAGASRLHQAVVTEFARQLGNQLLGKPCRPYVAPFDVRLPKAGEREGEESTVLQPDVVVCDRSRERERSLYGAPDFVLEVTSPSTSSRDHIAKRRLYEAAGVREYWLFDPESRLLLHLYRLGEIGFGKPDVVLGVGAQALACLSDVLIDLDLIEKPEGWVEPSLD